MLRVHRVLDQPWFYAWLIVLGLAVALTVFVELEALPDEAGLMRDVQSSGVPGQTIADAVRAVTTTWFVVAAGIAIAVLHFALGDRRAAVALVVLLVLLPLAQTGLKELVDRPRPSEVASGIEVRASQTSASFPAGHVMGPTAVYGWVLVMLVRSLRQERGVQKVRGHMARPGQGRQHPELNRGATHGLLLGVLWLIVGCLSAVLLLTGIVSVHLGVHWPTDVLGGYLWGFVLLLPGLQISKAAKEKLSAL